MKERQQAGHHTALKPNRWQQPISHGETNVVARCHIYPVHLKIEHLRDWVQRITWCDFSADPTSQVPPARSSKVSQLCGTRTECKCMANLDQSVLNKTIRYGCGAHNIMMSGQVTDLPRLHVDVSVQKVRIWGGATSVQISTPTQSILRTGSQ